MWISRVRVTGGFLNGLDLTFSRGLNVIIGARGAGKTTLLELIRHAIGAKHADERQARQHQEFLSAILGTGEVIVDIDSDDGGRHLVVDAKGGGQRPDLSNAVLVLGQSELENIASDAASRLNLIDLRAGTLTKALDRSEAAELTARLLAMREKIELLDEESTKRPRLESDREELASQEAALLGGSGEVLAAQRDDLRGKEEEVIRSTRDLQNFAAVANLLAETSTAQSEQTRRLNVLMRQAAELQAAEQLIGYLEEAAGLSERLTTLISPAEKAVGVATAATQERNLQLRAEAAPLRASLEEAESGLGQITAQLRNIDAELEALVESDRQKTLLEEEYLSLVQERSLLLDSVEAAEERTYVLRSELARHMTGQIADNVLIIVEHMADSREFRETLVKELRGSKTRSTLIDSVSDNVLPRQLLEMVERSDAAGLATAAGIAEDRAERLLASLNREQALRALTEVSLTDSVDFRLTDGATDKSVDSLSTGQKCAVTLPIILSEKHRTLILDQPEDHLDNAYLVDHVLSGIANRSEAQTIVATHNANIPVLGSAENVVVLRSNGTNGAVEKQGRFDDLPIVEWITGLMEGGKTAFAHRAKFYSNFGPKV